MRVESANVGRTSLADLKAGDAFEHQGGLFLATDEWPRADLPGDITMNVRVCVHLTVGYLLRLPPTMEVVPRPDLCVVSRKEGGGG